MSIYNNKKTLFYKLKKDCSKQWSSYTDHKFLDDLVCDKLPINKFKKYLIQDYIFLQNFLKILSLSSYKSRDFIEMNRSINFIISIKQELKLHINFCKKWNLSINKLNKTKALKNNLAYTNYVLKKGLKGDNLDLFTCLAPCIIGYGEIGLKLSKVNNWKKSKFKEWIQTYSSKEYQHVARSNINYLDELKNKHKKFNYKKLLICFKKSTVIEKKFWDMI